VRFRERLFVAAVSLLLTWLFFFDYLPPNKRVRLWSDIEGFHYPLLNYAHKSIMQGRIPTWDPAIYCGIPFAGNIQAGLFYPPNWLLFAANARLPRYLQKPGQHGMRFISVEILAFVHMWLAFLFTYLWLGERSRGILPPLLGGMTAACSGYLLSQMNHLGVACGYVWIPFALWGVEQANRERRWHPLWKVSAASALCVLAGYPPTWLAFALVVLTYAVALSGRNRLVILTLAAIVFSGAVAAVQLFPAYEASTFKFPEDTFGSETPFGNRLYVALLLPNYFNQNRTSNNENFEISEVDYLYLGVPVLFGALWLLGRGPFAGAGVALAISGILFFFIADPAGFVLRVIPHVPLAPELIRRHNLIAGIPIAAALFAASAVSDFLGQQARGVPAWLAWLWSAVVIAWSAALLSILQPFASGVGSIFYPTAALTILVSGLYLYRAQPTNLVLALVALAIFVDYRAFGSNRRFNAITDNADKRWRGDARLGGQSFAGLVDTVYHEMLRSPGYRLAIHEGPNATDMRHYGLATLQGFDPLLSEGYKAEVQAFQQFETNRLFDINPLNEDMLKHFGVRWVIVRREAEMHATLLQSTAFRRLQGESFFAVFEYLQAWPTWRFAGAAEITAWRPERRAFRVRSDAGGPFVLIEQFYPGWHATIDGKEASTSLAGEAFQSVTVPPGEHRLEFLYSPASLRIGGAITTVAVVALAALLWGERPRRRGSS
jgi:hypothetical protein